MKQVSYLILVGLVLVIENKANSQLNNNQTLSELERLKKDLAQLQTDLTALNTSIFSTQEKIKVKQTEIIKLQLQQKIETGITLLEQNLNGGINYYLRQNNPIKFNKKYMQNRWEYYGIDKKLIEIKTDFSSYNNQFGQNADLSQKLALIESLYNELKVKIDALL